MDLDDAVLLTDVVPTGYQAAEMGGIQPGDTVMVFGAGPVGIMAARCAWLFGRDASSSSTRSITARIRSHLLPLRGLQLQGDGRPGALRKKTTDWLGAEVCIDAVGAEANGSPFTTFSAEA
jgi:threonine dehydrogenase-like Zn-dependent dehydrogenase